MNEPEQERAEAPEEDGAASSGANLFLIYGLMLLALLVAIGIAAMIVWPFYKHR